MSLYRYTPCQHGETHEHRTGPYGVVGGGVYGTCSGASFVPVEIDYRAAAIEWVGADPPDNYPATRDDWEQMLAAVVEQSVKPMVAAALGEADDGTR